MQRGTYYIGCGRLGISSSDEKRKGNQYHTSDHHSMIFTPSSPVCPWEGRLALACFQRLQHDYPKLGRHFCSNHIFKQILLTFFSKIPFGNQHLKFVSQENKKILKPDLGVSPEIQISKYLFWTNSTTVLCCEKSSKKQVPNVDTSYRFLSQSKWFSCLQYICVAGK